MHIDNTIPLTWLIAGALSVLSFAHWVFVRIHITPLVERVKAAEEMLLERKNELTKVLDDRFKHVEEKLKEERSNIDEMRDDINQKFTIMGQKFDTMIKLQMAIVEIATIQKSIEKRMDLIERHYRQPKYDTPHPD